MKLTVVLTVVAAAASLAAGAARSPSREAPPPAQRGLASTAAASPGKRPRPSDAPPGSVVTSEAPNEFQLYNDYATPERRHAALRAVVHYVERGIDAPPLNDDDSDLVPDYVERVGEAADTAIVYYERRGFRPIRDDVGGGDTRPDLYVSRFTPGTFGVSFPAARAEGGAFVVVANNLDPSRGESFASLEATVAHELFHLVQFSYFHADVEPPLPGWALEGSAVALEGQAFPDLDDLVWELQLEPWLRAPQLSITRRTYSSWLLWRYLDTHTPRLLAAYVARCASDSRIGCRAAALADSYGRLTHRRFSAAFHRFAVTTADERGATITPRGRISRRTAGFHSSLAPLAIDYLRLSTGAGMPRSLTVSVPRRGGLAVTLAYQLESAVPGSPDRSVVIPHSSGGARTLIFRIPSRLAANPRFRRATLIVSNGSPTGPRLYTVAGS